MYRRQLLGAVGAAVALGGCTQTRTGHKTGDTVPAVSDSTLSIVNSYCVSETATRRHRCSAEYHHERQELEFNGTLVTHKPCLNLDLRIDTGVGFPDRYDDSMYLEIVYGAPQNMECEECPAEITYDSSVSFDSDPRTISIYHLERIRGRDEQVGPVESLEI